MTRRAGYRLQGMRSREEKRQSIQGFNANEEVIRTAVCGSPSLCHPEFSSGSGLRSYWRTAFPSVQRVLDFKRAAVLRSKMLKQVQHDRFRRFRNDVCYYSRHDFLEVPLIVIPNLVRDLGFGKPSLGVWGRGFRKNKKDWLNVERFSVCRGEPVLPERRSAPRSWLRSKTKT